MPTKRPLVKEEKKPNKEILQADRGGTQRKFVVSREGRQQKKHRESLKKQAAKIDAGRSFLTCPIRGLSQGGPSPARQEKKVKEAEGSLAVKKYFGEVWRSEPNEDVPSAGVDKI